MQLVKKIEIGPIFEISITNENVKQIESLCKALSGNESVHVEDVFFDFMVPRWADELEKDSIARKK